LWTGWAFPAVVLVSVAVAEAEGANAMAPMAATSTAMIQKRVTVVFMGTSFRRTRPNR
jgi:hypothetical protein